MDMKKRKEEIEKNLASAKSKYSELAVAIPQMEGALAIIREMEEKEVKKEKPIKEDK